ncbi:MAG: hypothetical protein J3R72DRAFT_497254 [Linnemannia gamsii]|nr:MAG: hypothetical protein J3R72DRAFT_497254 [Linnemannia gamsii]
MDVDVVDSEKWTCKDLKTLRIRIKYLDTKEKILKAIALWRKGCWRRWREQAGILVGEEGKLDSTDMSIEARVTRHLLKFEKLWWQGTLSTYQNPAISAKHVHLTRIVRNAKSLRQISVLANKEVNNLRDLHIEQTHSAVRHAQVYEIISRNILTHENADLLEVNFVNNRTIGTYTLPPMSLPPTHCCQQDLRHLSDMLRTHVENAAAKKAKQISIRVKVCKGELQT